MPDLFPLPHTKKYQAEREVEINVLSPADIKEVWWLCVLCRVKTIVFARENTLTHRQTYKIFVCVFVRGFVLVHSNNQIVCVFSSEVLFWFILIIK